MIAHPAGLPSTLSDQEKEYSEALSDVAMV
jgi:hypothetical protein